MRMGKVIFGGFPIIFVFLFIVNCAESGVPARVLDNTSKSGEGSDQNQNGTGEEGADKAPSFQFPPIGGQPGDTPVEGAPVLTISKSADGAANRYFGTKDVSYWRVENADSDLQYCATGVLDPTDWCKEEGGNYQSVPADGKFNAAEKSYRIAFDLAANSIGPEALYVYMRNGNGPRNRPFLGVVGIVNAIEVDGRLRNGGFVSKDFKLKSYGIEKDGAQWCFELVGTDVDDKCSNISNFEDISVANSDFYYSAGDKMMAIDLKYGNLERARYRATFRNKISGELSKELEVDLRR